MANTKIEQIAIAALAEIVNKEGRVCEQWANPRCNHAGCASSFLAWGIAVQALDEIKNQEKE